MELKIDGRVSFILLKNRELLDLGQKDMAKPAFILPAIDYLRGRLHSSKDDGLNDYKRYYEQYNRVLSFDTFYTASVEGAEYQLSRLEKESKETSAIDPLIDDVSGLSEYLLYSKYAVYFSNQWYLYPKLEFSELLLKGAFENDSCAFLFDSEQYDDSPESENHLEIPKMYYKSDPSLTYPHVIDKKHAKILSESLNRFILSSRFPSFLRNETDLFMLLLDKAIKDNYALLITNIP